MSLMLWNFKWILLLLKTVLSKVSTNCTCQKMPFHIYQRSKTSTSILFSPTGPPYFICITWPWIGRSSGAIFYRPGSSDLLLQTLLMILEWCITFYRRLPMSHQTRGWTAARFTSARTCPTHLHIGRFSTKHCHCLPRELIGRMITMIPSIWSSTRHWICSTSKIWEQFLSTAKARTTQPIITVLINGTRRGFLIKLMGDKILKQPIRYCN